jgi:hypothetical protein
MDEIEADMMAEYDERVDKYEPRARNDMDFDDINDHVDDVVVRMRGRRKIEEEDLDDADSDDCGGENVRNEKNGMRGRSEKKINLGRMRSKVGTRGAPNAADDIAIDLSFVAQSILPGLSQGPKLMANDMMSYAMQTQDGSTNLSQIGSQMRINNDIESGNIVLKMASYLTANFKLSNGSSTCSALCRIFLEMASMSNATMGLGPVDNVIPELADDYVEAGTRYWKLSNGNTLTPELDMSWCTMNEFVDVLTGTQRPALADFDPEWWNLPSEDGVIIVPMSSQMLDQGVLNYAWAKAWGEYPWKNYLENDIELVDLENASYITTPDMVPVPNSVRIQGAYAKVLFVICNIVQSIETSVVVGGGTGRHELDVTANLVRGVNPVNMTTADVTASDNSVDRTIMVNCWDRWIRYFGSRDDAETAFTVLSDFMGATWQSIRQHGDSLERAWQGKVEIADPDLGNGFNVLVTQTAPEYQVLAQTPSGMRYLTIPDVRGGRGDARLTKSDYTVYTAIMGNYFSYVDKMVPRGKQTASSLYLQAYMFSNKITVGGDFLSESLGLSGVSYINSDLVPYNDRVHLLKKSYEGKMEYWLNYRSSSTMYRITTATDDNDIIKGWYERFYNDDGLSRIPMVRLNPRWISVNATMNAHCTSTWLTLRPYGYTTMQNEDEDYGDRIDYDYLKMVTTEDLRGQVRKIMTQAIAADIASGETRYDISNYELATKTKTLGDLYMHTGNVGVGVKFEEFYSEQGLSNSSQIIDLPFSSLPMSLDLEEGQKSVAIWIAHGEGVRVITAGIGTVGKIIYYKDSKDLDINTVDRDINSVDTATFNAVMSFL